MASLSLALIVFLFPLAFSPGPGNMFFAANGARFGLRATLPANAGYHVATLIVAMAIGLGALAALQSYPAVFGLLKTAGALYVLWLAWGMLRSGAHSKQADARPAGFGSGALLLLLNPKAYVIIALMFSQFMADAGANDWQRVAVISGIFTLNNMVAFVVWTIVGDQLAARFRDEKSARRINIAFAGTLDAVALWMLLA